MEIEKSNGTYLLIVDGVARGAPHLSLDSVLEAAVPAAVDEAAKSARSQGVFAVSVDLYRASPASRARCGELSIEVALMSGRRSRARLAAPTGF